MMHQYLLGFWFYLVFSLFAAFGLFFTLKLFPQKKELAYFLAKPLGLGLFGYLVWLLASLKFLNYQNSYLIAFVFFVCAAIGLFFAYREVSTGLSKAEGKKLLKNLLLLELVSLLLYFGYLYIRSFNAAAYGTERFMDMALLNASMKTQHFPFVDPWYAGKVVNYYYYGHYLVSLVTKLSGVSSFLTYNFAIGILYTVSFGLSGLFVHALTKSKGFAVLAGFLVTTAGSMFYASCALSTWLKGEAICSYASSTRFYTPSYIINEIPSYSFTVGDMHAHFLALPFFVMNVILIYALYQAEKPNKIVAFSLLAGIITSALVNPSDATTLALLLTLVGLWKIYLLYKNKTSVKQLFKIPEFKAWLWLTVFLGISGVVLYLPFLLNFVSPVLGFGFAPAYAAKHGFLFDGYQYPTPFFAFLGEWGVYVLVIALCIYFLRKHLKDLNFAVICFLAGLFLIAFVELFFVKDIYSIANPPYFRANTVFKYGYHVWTLLSLSFCLFLAFAFRTLSESRRFKALLGTLKWLVAIFVFFGLFYPAQAVEQFYFTSTEQPTLDASKFMQKESPGDLATVNYINENISDRSVVLEAVGDSYSYFARMSVLTGQIATMGWKSHEWTWRFQGKEAEKIKEKDPNANVETGYGAVAGVAMDTQTIYETPSLDTALTLIKKYDVQYVYIGDLERKTYPNLQIGKFYTLGSVVFQSGNSILFKVY